MLRFRSDTDLHRNFRRAVLVFLPFFFCPLLVDFLLEFIQLENLVDNRSWDSGTLGPWVMKGPKITPPPPHPPDVKKWPQRSVLSRFSLGNFPPIFCLIFQFAETFWTFAACTIL